MVVVMSERSTDVSEIMRQSEQRGRKIPRDEDLRNADAAHEGSEAWI